ncbi:MAG: ABC transporter ATP-binding protein [Ilumatobacteraceae bacterium]
MSLLEIDDLSIEFGSPASPLVAVQRVSLSIAEGEVVGLVGESGSGKSLTCRAIMRLVAHPGRITGGDIRFDGRAVLDMSNQELRRFRRNDVGMVVQDPSSSLNPVFRIGNQMSTTLRTNLGLDRSAARSVAIEMLDGVGIPRADHVYRSYPHELSGGMRQRVMIALATAGQPRLLLADEPTTALDVLTQKQILLLLADMRRERNMAMLLVSHDFGVIAQMCDRVAVMYGGRIVETGAVADIYDDPHHPYTRSLLRSVPTLERTDRADRRDLFDGKPPEIGPVRHACVFVDRCPHARAECSTRSMELVSFGEGRQSACPFETTIASTA